ncbi:MAG: hypothetical protein AAGA56_27960, partial [Myxococcota bacterium]
WFDPHFEGSLPTAAWWAFLRLSDPGYLGDDTGTGRRVVSTILTVAGYVVFLGALVAILTQSLNAIIRRLESGITPIAEKGHVVVVGMNTRTPLILAELLRSQGRMRRFLARARSRVLRIVVLVRELTPALRQDLRDGTEGQWSESRVILRSGSPLKLDHLMRVDIGRAAAILLPGEDIAPDGVPLADAETIKGVATVSHQVEQLGVEHPALIAEVFDARQVQTARHAYRGPIEVIATDQLLGRVMCLAALYPDMLLVFEELFTFRWGVEVHLLEAAAEGLAGQTWGGIRHRLTRGVPLGVVSPSGRSYLARLAPSVDTTVGEDDRLVVVAPNQGQIDVDDDSSDPPAAPPPRTDSDDPALAFVLERSGGRPHPILVLGWSDRVPYLLQELRAHVGGAIPVDNVSVLSADERHQLLADFGLADRTSIRMMTGDLLQPKVYAPLAERTYSSVVIIANDRVRTGGQSDARSHLAFLQLKRAFEDAGAEFPRVIVELMDTNNRELFDFDDVETFAAPVFVGHLFAHIALRQELRAVYDELLGGQGAQLALRHPRGYGPADKLVEFSALREHGAQWNEIVIGVIEGTPPRAHLDPRPDDVFAKEALRAIVVMASKTTSVGTGSKGPLETQRATTD